MKRRRGPLAMLGVTAAITVTTRSGFWLACWALALGVGLIGAHLARCWRHSAEQAVRKSLSMAPDHPERLTRRVSRKHRMLFARLAGEAWPHSEYIHIVDEERQEQQRREES